MCLCFCGILRVLRTSVVVSLILFSLYYIIYHYAVILTIRLDTDRCKPLFCNQKLCPIGRLSSQFIVLWPSFIQNEIGDFCFLKNWFKQHMFVLCMYVHMELTIHNVNISFCLMRFVIKKVQTHSFELASIINPILLLDRDRLKPVQGLIIP